MNPLFPLVILLLVLLSGALVYCILAIAAARQYLSVRSPAPVHTPPISLLRPLHGSDEDTEENLRRCFTQEYSEFEILAGVRQLDDPAAAVFERVCAEFPAGPAARLIVTGAPYNPNAKAHSLERLIANARYDVLVMADSDVRPRPGMLRVLAAEFQDPSVGVVTCPYRAVAGHSIWSRLECIGMNTEFLAGVLVARMVDGMKFALGPVIAARRDVIDRVGGFQQLGEFLAEDFVLGHRAAEQGDRVLLSSCVIEHRIGSQPFGVNMRHRLRWARSTRRSRPAGYWGQVFTNPLPLAFLLCMVDHRAWPLLVLTAAFRALAAWSTASQVLSSSLSAVDWLLLPIQDFLSFCLWTAGFFGDEIWWGGKQYRLQDDGRFELVTPTHAFAEAAQPKANPAVFAPRPHSVRPFGD
ncbi:MAG TPA: bacteriohopanetetrol glucosamine biosynthesis glycosyltransferase HpnI [Candidatus Acidoferrales bacterium]|nr:bacteriohopanetetrol glucosamine biosynthesis glycosyltransferase HpnI [Candidatus Acidoferrales bacterium]